jgi:hypothetical protein
MDISVVMVDLSIILEVEEVQVQMALILRMFPMAVLDN